MSSSSVQKAVATTAGLTLAQAAIKSGADLKQAALSNAAGINPNTQSVEANRLKQIKTGRF